MSKISPPEPFRRRCVCKSYMKPSADFSPEDIDRIIEMAWEDRTPFDAIETQFGLKEDDVKVIMKREMHPRNWRKWRARVQGRITKHAALSAPDMVRFKCSRQKSTGNRIAKKKY